MIPCSELDEFAIYNQRNNLEVAEANHKKVMVFFFFFGLLSIFNTTLFMSYSFFLFKIDSGMLICQDFVDLVSFR